MTEVVNETLDIEVVKIEILDKLGRFEGMAPDSEALNRLQPVMELHGSEDKKLALFDAFISAQTDFERVLIAVELMNCFRRDPERRSDSNEEEVFALLNDLGKKFPMPYSSIVRSYVRSSQMRLGFKLHSYGKANPSSMAYGERGANHAKKAMESSEDDLVLQHPVARGIFFKALSSRTDAYLELNDTDRANAALKDEEKFGFKLSGKNLAFRELSFAVAGLDELQLTTSMDDAKIKTKLSEALLKTEQAVQHVSPNMSSYLDVHLSALVLQYKIISAYKRFGFEVPESIPKPNDRIRRVIEERLTVIGKPELFSEAAEDFIRTMMREKLGDNIIAEAKTLLGFAA